MIARPLRRGVVLFLIVLIVEYLVVPELTGASKDLNLLGQLNPSWLAAGVILEGLSLFGDRTGGPARGDSVLGDAP